MLQILKKTIYFLGIFFLASAWMFSGWPQIVIERPGTAGPNGNQLAYKLPPGIFTANAADTFIFITSTASSTVTLPDDWSDTNTIHVIGGGGGGSSPAGLVAAESGGGGGGGAAYASTTATGLSAGANVDINVGAGGGVDTNGENSWFNGTTCGGSSVCAGGGGRARIETFGGTAGAVQVGSGFSGGAGGDGGGVSGNNKSGGGGGGGGGAAGPNGAGGNGIAGSRGSGGNPSGDGSGGNGGDGDASSVDGGTGGTGGAAGSAGGNGTDGTNWTETTSSNIGGSGGAGGGGGGGGNNSSGGLAGTSGQYGAGGAGGGGSGDGSTVGGTASAGIQGIIVLQYTPTVSNNPPDEPSNVTLNDNNEIILNPNSTKAVSSKASTTDPDGAVDLVSATSVIYRSGVTGGAGCTNNDNDCYRLGSSACSFAASTSTVTCTANIQFFADPTDASSTNFSTEDWDAQITITDAAGASNSSSTANGVELATLWAISVTANINYGQVSPGINTGPTNQVATTTNTGNAALDLEFSGTDMTDGAGHSIAVGNQKYATSSFTYDGCSNCFNLSTTDTAREVELVKPTSLTPVEEGTFWGLAVPSGTASGTYTGQNTFNAIGD